MPAHSKKQANLFRAALGEPEPGSNAAKIKSTVPREKIKHFTHVGESESDMEEGTLETLGLTESKRQRLKEILRPIISEVLKESKLFN